MKKGDNNEKGMVLVTVIIFGAIIIMLGVALLSTGVMEVKSGNFFERNTQAYYVAKAGADIVAKKIMDGPIVFTESEVKTFSGSMDANNTYSVTATKSGNQIALVSEGISNNVKDVVNLNLLETNTSTSTTITYTDLDMAIFAYNSLNLNCPITGDVRTNSIQPNAVTLGWDTDNGRLSGTIFIGKDGDKNTVVSTPLNFNRRPNIDNQSSTARTYQSPVMPTAPEGLTTPIGTFISEKKYFINGNKADDLKLTSDAYFEEMNIIESSKLTIDLNGQNRVIVVDKLTISGTGNIVVKNGTLEIYVRKEFNFKESATLNDETNNPEKLKVYYGKNPSDPAAPDAPLTISGGTKFCGILQSNLAPITFTRGNTASFKGTLISATTGTIEISGGFRTITNVLYAPNATVKVSATFNGSIICNEMISSGGEPIVGPLRTTPTTITIPVSSSGGGGSVEYKKTNYQ